MVQPAGAPVNEILEQVSTLGGERLKKPEAKAFDAFAGALFRHVADEDIKGAEVEAIYGAAHALWSFAAERPPGAPKLRAYNPTVEEQGWTTEYTVVEIINDDMPFLVDSITMKLGDLGLGIHVMIHPVVRVKRDGKGIWAGLAQSGDAKGDGLGAESHMHLQVDRISTPAALDELCNGLLDILGDVRVAVEDWPAMLERLAATTETLTRHPPSGISSDEAQEAVAFLSWLGDNHFTVLGYREYDFQPGGKAEPLKIVEGSGLGLLRDPDFHILAGASGFTSTSAEVLHFLRQPDPIIITKANKRSTVHRPVHMDYIGVKRLDSKGNMVGESRLIGLFTSVSYSRSPLDIPLLRRKVESVRSRAGFTASSHDGKALMHIMETFPRDELFQISDELLYEFSIGILRLQERPRPRVFVRPDRFERFVSALVYLPRERYDTDLRQSVEKILADAYDGEISAQYTQVDDSKLARLHLIVRTNPGAVPVPDVAALENDVAAAALSWGDALRDALVENRGEEAGKSLWSRYSDAFPVSYREVFSATAACADIAKIETLLPGEDGGEGQDVALDFYRNPDDAAEAVRFKIYHAKGLLPLSDCLPMLEGMGLKVLNERPYHLELDDGENGIWMHDFSMLEAGGRALNLDALQEKLESAFARVWRGEMENDRFNRLVLRAGLEWREVVVLRAFAKYLRQAAVPFSQAYMEDTLAAHPGIAQQIVALFDARFDPSFGKDREARVTDIESVIEAGLEDVVSLDEDRIIRRYLNLVQAILRTNFYQRALDGGPKPYISFKFDSLVVEELPLPRPFVEVFVYSPRVEAVHLRGGKVARGGIRWSDRREDFRTEVLGLMKAQMVKNVVIIPVGAKGGFVTKRLPVDGSRDEVMEEVVTCYKTFMSGLLDITDNRKGAKTTPPKDVVRYDDDDPYLVVAADKGTATFSDIANGVSLEYGHWLGDAFASGGSVGYDHKVMGITARGAWESVKRHFRELGLDVQTESFSVIGIGDMSGDVFGNGMLRSEQINLIAAFDHRHVFIDPDPDPASSFKERARLFELPRSSWDDYDRKLISKGGGVFGRNLKAIELTPEVKKLFGLERDTVTPAELIGSILRAQADLLWIGGIGTYVKAASESNVEVGDRANDGLRINGGELRCRVVGEGGNLGFTQLGRVEYARQGGRLNTDAVDNSGGVDCSDREVNIKILVNALVAEGEMTGKQRDKLLSEMTDEVAELVLTNNYRQGEAITLVESQSAHLLDMHTRFMQTLQRQGRLDRQIEDLPDDEALQELATNHHGLVRPEISVLLAYGKMTLYTELLNGDLPDDPYLDADLLQSFPGKLQAKYGDQIKDHPLRREIAATLVANSLVNRLGPTFVTGTEEEEGSTADSIARAFVIARDAFDMRALWRQIGELDNQVPAAVQTRMLREIANLLGRQTLWFLRNVSGGADITKVLEDYRPGIAELIGCLESTLSGFEGRALKQRAKALVKEGVPKDLAERVAVVEPLASACDIVGVALDQGRPVAEVAEVYFAIGTQLGIDWLRANAELLATDDHWEKLALAAVVEDLFGQQRALTSTAILSADGGNGHQAVEAWKKANADSVERAQDLIDELKGSGLITVAKLTFANRRVRRLIVS